MKSFFTLMCACVLGSLGLLSGQNQAMLDPSFATQGKLVLPQSRTGDLVAAFPDESLLMIGNPMSNGTARLMKLKPDGSTDASFASNGSFTLQIMERATRIYDVLIRPEAIYLCGSTSTDVGGTTTFGYMAALLPDGSGLKTDFADNGIKKFQSPKVWYFRALLQDSQGDFYLGGTKSIGKVVVAKLTNQGQLDASFGTNGLAEFAPSQTGHWYDGTDASLDWHPDGDMLFAFKFMRATSGSNDPNFSRIAVAKISSGGQLNSAFAQNGIGFYNYDSTSLDLVSRVHARNDGRIVVSAMTWTGFDYDYLAVGLDASGNLDPSFGQQGKIKWDLNGQGVTEGCYNSILLSDGRLLLTGNHGSGDTVYFAMAMLTPNGQADQSFHSGGYFKNIFNENNNSSSSGAVLTPQGKVVLSGYTRTCSNGVCGILQWAAARYTIPESNLSLQDQGNKHSKLMYPNPGVSGQSIQLPQSGLWELKNMQGQSIMHTQMFTDRLTLPQHLSAGLYFIVSTESGNTYSLMVQNP